MYSNKKDNIYKIFKKYINNDNKVLVSIYGVSVRIRATHGGGGSMIYEDITNKKLST
jgi:hypothetical protein